MECNECMVCFEKSATKKLLPCNHDACKMCMMKWFAKGHASCPLCRNIVCSFNNDNITGDILLTFPTNTHAGLTIRDCDTGCLIIHLKKTDQAYRCGMKKGQILLSVNGIMCKDVGHQNVAKILTQASMHGINCYCNMQQSRIFNFNLYRLYKKR